MPGPGRDAGVDDDEGTCVEDDEGTCVEDDEGTCIEDDDEDQVVIDRLARTALELSRGAVSNSGRGLHDVHSVAVFAGAGCLARPRLAALRLSGAQPAEKYDVLGTLLLFELGR